MKKYDFVKAKKIILKNKELIESASLGMHEDWFWTADEVWAMGEWKTKLTAKSMIGGINGSAWATPCLHLKFKDGTDKMIEVSKGKSSSDKSAYYAFGLGVLSGPVQDSITPITKEKP